MSSFKKFFKLVVLIVLFLMGAKLIFDIFYGQYSLSESAKLEDLIEKKEIELETITLENENLKEEISNLKNNEEYVEHIARENLGLIKEDEIYIDEDPE